MDGPGVAGPVRSSCRIARLSHHTAEAAARKSGPGTWPGPLLHCRSAVAAAAGRFATLASDLRHVLAIAADGFAALAPGLACFLRVELVRGAFLMRRTAALRSDFPLLVIVHG